jgi:hypothetical protein
LHSHCSATYDYIFSFSVNLRTMYSHIHMTGKGTYRRSSRSAIHFAKTSFSSAASQSWKSSISCVNICSQLQFILNSGSFSVSISCYSKTYQYYVRF